MDVLKFLKSIRAKQNELHTLIDTRDTLRLMLLPSGIRYDLDKVQTSPEDRMPGVASDLVEIENNIDRCVARLSKDIRLAQEVIEQCPSPECRELLMLRYVSGDRRRSEWNEIAKKMGYSASHVNGYLHGKAISEARVAWKNVSKQ